MIDLKNLKDRPQDYQRSADLRGLTIDTAEIIKLDDQRLKLLGEVEQLRSQLKQSAKPTAAELTKLKATKAQLERVEKELEQVQVKLDELVRQVPNLIAEDVPTGKDESENQVIRQWGQKPKFGYEPKEHWQLGEERGLINLQKASEVAGSRFAYLMGGLVKLQFALVNFVISQLTDEKVIAEIIKGAKLKVSTKPFVPVVPPTMIRSKVLQEMARLEPVEDRYQLPEDDLFLTGSAEHALGPIHRGEILAEGDLPKRYLGYSTAYRREAGSYGKDVRGILRVHQFDKLEMESFCLPEESVQEQEFLVAIQEYLMQQLELPYQVVAICTGDMGDPDARQIDIETWLPGQNKYRETHTADLMTDYQARRLKIKVRREDGSTELVHMNDATAMAIGRILIAIMENNQTETGQIKVPKVLRELVGEEEI